MLRSALLAALAVALAAPTAAQSFGSAPAVRASDVVTWTVGSNHGSRGGEAAIVVRAEIEEGWHLYAIGSPVGRPLEIEVAGLPAGASAEPILQSTPHQGTDPGLGVPYLYFSEEARLEVPVALSRRAARGRHTVRGTIRYAVCDDAVCLPPTATRFSVPLVVR